MPEAGRDTRRMAQSRGPDTTRIKWGSSMSDLFPPSDRRWQIHHAELDQVPTGFRGRPRIMRRRALRCGPARRPARHARVFFPAPAPRRAYSRSCCWALALPWRWWAASPRAPPSRTIPGADRCSSWRASFSFALAIRPLGLIVSGLMTFLISALGSDETRWVEAIIVGVCLTIGCAFLFPYVLGLPMPLFHAFPGAVRSTCSSCFKISVSASPSYFSL